MRIFLALFFLFIPSSIYANTQLSTACDDFAKSYKLKGEERKDALQASAQKFEIALKSQNLNNAFIHYNLGTIYLMLEDYGKSIFHLKRAHEINPNDTRIVSNLHRAGQLAGVELSVSDKKEFGSIIHGYWKSISIKTWQLSAFMASWLFALWYFFSGKRIGILIFSIFCISLILVVAEMRSLGVGINREVVLLTSYNPRNGTNEDYPVKLKKNLKPGFTAILLREQSGWCELLISGEHRGWVPKNKLGFVN